MRILGIDPGLAIVGYGVIEKTQRGIEFVDCGVINTPKTESMPVRLAQIDGEMAQLIKEYAPDEIAVEELFFSKNVTTALPVAHARGVILLNAVLNCGQIFEYTPMQVKQALTGTGAADKKQVQYMVRSILRLKEAPQPDDAADALAVAICHAHTARFSERNRIL